MRAIRNDIKLHSRAKNRINKKTPTNTISYLILRNSQTDEMRYRKISINNVSNIVLTSLIW